MNPIFREAQDMLKTFITEMERCFLVEIEKFLCVFHGGSLVPGVMDKGASGTAPMCHC
jgi:hypothetical protein